MKKIDFHIHTVATEVDAAFTFDLAKLEEYVIDMELDGIAITNHNKFDEAQFRTISNSLNIVVLPGIEINLGAGHALLIADNSNLTSFSTKCREIEHLIRGSEDFISVSKLREIFGDLSHYLIIPHYDKKPSVDNDSLDELGDDFIAGEVTSAKKFVYAQKHDELPTPVLFSDARAKREWSFKTRQTFVDISDINVRSLRHCLADKTKVALSTAEGNELIQVTPGGTSISSGLTVVLGGRSSGKSYTLDEIEKSNDNVKYIRQFELIEADSKAAEKFNEGLSKKQRDESDAYLKQFRNVIDDVKNISLNNDDRNLQQYTDSLLKSASEVERQDLYSSTALFSERAYTFISSSKLPKLINATIELLDPGVYDELVGAHVSKNSLIRLLLALIGEHRNETLEIRKKEWVNELVDDIQHALNSESAVTPIVDVDFLEIVTNKRKVAKFEEITKELQKPRTIAEKRIQRFTIQERSVAITRPLDLKEISGRRASFQSAFDKYDNPYDFLMSLKDVPEIDSTSYYKFFTKIEFAILNEYQVPVSGGERAEFRLINEIDGASKFDMLLIDEPESSFDNIFLCSDVNATMKEIAKTTPVVVVTHNNSVGASIRPDYVIYTHREIVDREPVHKVYTGLASDSELVAKSGERISNSEVMLKYLEAGRTEYDERRRLYESLEN